MKESFAGFCASRSTFLTQVLCGILLIACSAPSYPTDKGPAAIQQRLTASLLKSGDQPQEWNYYLKFTSGDGEFTALGNVAFLDSAAFRSSSIINVSRPTNDFVFSMRIVDLQVEFWAHGEQVVLRSRVVPNDEYTGMGGWAAVHKKMHECDAYIRLLWAPWMVIGDRPSAYTSLVLKILLDAEATRYWEDEQGWHLELVPTANVLRDSMFNFSPSLVTLFGFESETYPREIIFTSTNESLTLACDDIILPAEYLLSESFTPER